MHWVQQAGDIFRVSLLHVAVAALCVSLKDDQHNSQIQKKQNL